MNTTGEIRTCEECSKTYLHEPYFIFDEPGGKDWNAEVYTCPECLSLVEEREKAKRLEREERERQEAHERAARAAWETVVPRLYRDTRTDHPGYPGKIHREAMAWLKKGEPPTFFGIIGPTGKGKTRVASQAMRGAIQEGKNCAWVNAAEFQRLVQSQWDNSPSKPRNFGAEVPSVGEEARKRLKSFRDCQFLVFDDLGKGRITETVAGGLYDLIEERVAEGRRTVWTSNATLQILLRMLPEDCGRPIVRRLAEFSTIIEI